MEFKSCPQYRRCTMNDLFVIRCNNCPYYKGYKSGYAKAKKKYEKRMKGEEE